MELLSTLFDILDINKANLNSVAKDTGISTKDLKYYNDNRKFPANNHLSMLCDYFKVSPEYLKIRLGIIDFTILKQLSNNAEILQSVFNKESNNSTENISFIPSFQTKLGKLYNSDSIQLMKTFSDDFIDLIFADPPFNLNKEYPSKMNDALKEEEYLIWQEQWIEECVRILKPGGSLFIWNLPKWNTYASSFLNDRLTFRDWISVDLKFSLPISGRLYPSHYSLLYYVKGKRPNYFKPDRLPMQVCPKCYGDIKDYGGYKNKMNPSGVNMSDVWTDIPPVRHKKYKRRNGANELSIKLLDRVIEMASEENDLVFDPFGGAGTTYIVSEIKKRRWIGSEIGPLDDIINRFSDIETEKTFIQSIRENLNALFPPKIFKQRVKRNLWTTETFATPINIKKELSLSLPFGEKLK